MTISELIKLAELYQNPILIYFFVIPVLGFLLGWIHEPTPKKNTTDYLLSFVLFSAVIPGISSILLIAYSLFFLNQNLLNVNAIVYFLPVLSMIVTFRLISRNVPLRNIPGFGKVSSFFVMLVIIGFVIFFFQRLGIHLIFFGSFGTLLIIGLLLIIVFYIAYQRFFSS